MFGTSVYQLCHDLMHISSEKYLISNTVRPGQEKVMHSNIEYLQLRKRFLNIFFSKIYTWLPVNIVNSKSVSSFQTSLVNHF